MSVGAEGSEINGTGISAGDMDLGQDLKAAANKGESFLDPMKRGMLLSLVPSLLVS